MSIGTTVRIAGPYIGDGSSLVFPVSFKLFTKQDVYAVKTVIATGINTVLVLDTDYTVTLNGDQNYTPGGTITLTTPLLATEKLTITTAVANLQPIDLNNQGGFYPDVINTGFDRATVQIQQLNDTITRTIRVPVTDGVTANQELPTKELRANKYFYFDSSGNPTVAPGTSGSTVPTSAVNLTLTANDAGANTGRDTIVYDYVTELARFQGSTGRVGIGTATPATTLDVRKNTATTAMLNGPTGRGLFMLRDATATNEYTCLDFAQANGTVTGRIGVLYGASGSTMQFGTSNNYATGITNTGLSIDSAGTVTVASRFAVGTATPITIWKGLLADANSIGIGNNTLAATTSGANNVCLGVNAGNNITTGSFNVGIGNATNIAATGNYQIAIGYQAKTILDDVCIGFNAGQRLGASASANVAIGKSALGGTGAALNISSSVAIGVGAMASAGTTATLAVAVGINALSSNNGIRNTAVGGAAGQSCTTGQFNTYLGYLAGSTHTTGSTCTILGYSAEPSSASASNEVTLGSSAVATLRCQVTTITSLSDQRDKKNIQDLPSVMPLIDALRPRSFVWNMRDGGKVNVPEIGFIAQELLQAQELSGITVPNLVYQENPDRLEAGPGTLLPILLQAIKELKATVESQAARIAALEAMA
jgi:hypothetical protein